jgi:hypothetical protein
MSLNECLIAPGPAPAKVASKSAKITPIASKKDPSKTVKVAEPRFIPKTPTTIKHEKTHKVEKETIQQQSDIH